MANFASSSFSKNDGKVSFESCGVLAPFAWESCVTVRTAKRVGWMWLRMNTRGIMNRTMGKDSYVNRDVLETGLGIT